MQSDRRFFHHRLNVMALIAVVLAAFMIIAMPLSVRAADEGAGADSAALTQAEIELRADSILSQMSTSEKIAQMMLVCMPASEQAEVQEKYQFGGYILFARDFNRTSKSGMKKLIKSCQEASDTGMLIAVDEEGGTVVRASYYRKYRKSRFLSPRQVYQAGGYDAVTSDTRKKDKFLRSLGINCNLAPVADVTYRKSDFMYRRSFANSAGKVSKFVRLAVKQMDKDDMVSSLKHFPGYGKNGDTHGRIIRDKRKYLTFLTRDLRPFRAGIDNGADMIMMSHTIVNAFDRKYPVSLSRKAHKYIREDMGFDGVIITDGLAMKGVTDFAGSQGKAAVRAVKAGNDMLCITGNYKKCYKAVKDAVKDGSISKKQIDESVRRILIMKIRRGIISDI